MEMLSPKRPGILWRCPMARSLIAFATGLLLITIAVPIHAGPRTDTLETSGGALEITPLGHASVMFKYRGQVIHVDPFGKMADYSKLPKADLVLITHEHFDHFDPDALRKIMKEKTPVVSTEVVSRKLKHVSVMRNGDVKEIMGLNIEAVPAYNIVHKGKGGKPFHPKGRGNGYVITFRDKRVYIAGDTENTPEMKSLKGIDTAFLPVNLPYTMDAEMVVDAVKAFKPKILYPYHYALGKSDLPRLKDLMKGVERVEFRAPK
jgi:L-ascorbate metabolism protein UlaG (beta-lactamase superfamily)